MYATHITGVLTANPFENNVKLSLARTLPLMTEQDFYSMSTLPTSDVPVWVTHSEHYQLQLLILKAIEEMMPQDLVILLRMQMPAGGRMPKGLLRDHILLLQDVVGEEQQLIRQAQNFAVIDDHIIRYPMEAGDNRVTIRLYSRYQTQYSLAPILDLLNAFKFKDIRFEDHIL